MGRCEAVGSELVESAVVIPGEGAGMIPCHLLSHLVKTF